MNNQTRTCKLKCRYNVQSICYAYGECIAKDLFIAELEKIKAEIQTIKDMEVVNGGVYVREFDVVEIIEKHISELKGENNE